MEFPNVGPTATDLHVYGPKHQSIHFPRIDGFCLCSRQSILFISPLTLCHGILVIAIRFQELTVDNFQLLLKLVVGRGLEVSFPSPTASQQLAAPIFGKVALAPWGRKFVVGCHEVSNVSTVAAISCWHTTRPTGALGRSLAHTGCSTFAVAIA